MPTDPRRIAPLDWRALVDETIRRRKAEKLTQREHAALASVSVPTIVAFDRGEETLTLTKAFDILRVVGLLDESEKKEGAQGAFVQEAFTRWRALTKDLPQDSPGRFTNGWYRFDYALEGGLIDYELHEFKELLRKSVLMHTGWPLFLFAGRPDLEPYEQDGVIECWLKPSDAAPNRPLGDPAHSDFWRAAPTGRAFIIRGYQEDSQDTFSPKTIFDTTLPTWRLGEVALHAKNIVDQLAQDQEKITVRLRALYTGLSGRVLRAWANPLADLIVEGGAARSDEALLETSIPAKEIENNLARYIHPLIASLFERFGVTGLSIDRVEAELEKMKNNRFSSVRG
ncbi:MAG TPA: transcriptional regulator [Xanthobacteraceae bacterium]|jgi:transcriptional regulator with XRE-family HTH domain|nr:transcriptional regulator [Xanthobacteraceae bacterium]